MLKIIAIINFVIAVIAFVWGFSKEYRQSRQKGPVAIVATIPFGVIAALTTTIGAAILVGRDFPIWTYILMFIGLAILFGYVITLASCKA